MLVLIFCNLHDSNISNNKTFGFTWLFFYLGSLRCHREGITYSSSHGHRSLVHLALKPSVYKGKPMIRKRRGKRSKRSCFTQRVNGGVAPRAGLTLLRIILPPKGGRR